MSPSGGLQAQGLLNLLGAPPMDPLTLVLREAAQNAWDARLTESNVTPTMLVRVRTLSSAQAQAMRDLLLTDRTGEPPDLDWLSTKLRASTEIPVLEICDFGTEGLSGSVDPVRESSRFVRFFFDVGASHFDGSTGGTYGFGRSSLYLAGMARTIVVDSMPAAGKGSRRFMACRLGDSYQRTSGQGSGKRHTGRHFWGELNRARSGVEPISGASAGALSRRLGFPTRQGPGDSGTSILIPWPLLDLTTAQHLISQILYHNLWPKLVPFKGKVPMRLEVDAGGEHVSLTIERAHAVYRAFAAALSVARSRRPPAKGIGPNRPAVTTGYVAVAPTGNLTFDDPPESGPDPVRPFRDGACHVALMRASELVVKYMRVDVESPAAPWVGTLLIEPSPDVAAAFATAEPPAHDDWHPGKLSGQAATLVRVTLRRLQGTIQELLGIRHTKEAESQEIASLAIAADHFARQFMDGDGTGAASGGGGNGGGGGGSSTRQKVSTPEFLGFEVDGERTLARYGVVWSSSTDGSLLATADIAIDGGTLSEPLAGLTMPEVVKWVSPSGAVSTGTRCRTSGAGRYEITVAYGDVYAVSLSVTQEAPR